MIWRRIAKIAEICTQKRRGKAAPEQAVLPRRIRRGIIGQMSESARSLHERLLGNGTAKQARPFSGRRKSPVRAAVFDFSSPSPYRKQSSNPSPFSRLCRHPLAAAGPKPFPRRGSARLETKHSDQSGLFGPHHHLGGADTRLLPPDLYIPRPQLRRLYHKPFPSVNFRRIRPCSPARQPLHAKTSPSAGQRGFV